MSSESKITLSGHIDLRDVVEWRSADMVVFDILGDATLDAFAEGSALAFLYGCKQANKLICAECRFDPVEGGEKEFFNSLFGLALCYLAEKISVSGNDQALPRIREVLWRRVYASRGLFADAKRHVMVFREPDYLVPECLALYLSGRSAFPLTGGFKSYIREAVRSLGFKSFGMTDREDMLGQFLYEAARNSYEHGRVPHRNGGPLVIRGIRVDKLIYSSSEDFERRLTSQPQIRRYLKQNWVDGTRKNPFVSITVTDVGAGIQNTLQPSASSPGESVWDRLERAVFTNATCKPEGDEVERGQGLKKVIEAAQQLDALLLLQSAGLFGYIDFSIPSKYPPTNGPLNKLDLQSSEFAIGTTWQVIWPIRAVGQQVSLPFARGLESE